MRHMSQEDDNMSEFRKNLGARFAGAYRGLEQAKGGRDIGHQEFADMLAGTPGGKRVSQGSVSKWMNGEVHPQLELIPAIAYVLNVDPGWLAFGDDSEAPMPDWARPKVTV